MSFSNRCYTLLKKVPKGKLTTYKALAHALNSKAYRAVGNAMNKNPNAPKVPCHRVINSSGKIGKYASGVPKKIALLKSEGIPISGGKVENLNNYLHKF